MHVCVDARIPSGAWGGVESVAIGLASGLSTLEGTNDRYTFLVYRGEASWIEDHISGPCRIAEVHRPHRGALTSLARRALRRSAWLRDLGLDRLAFLRRSGSAPTSDGTLEKLGADLVHFVTQAAFTTAVPSIYHPHDLQHEHLPEFFTQAELWRRRRLYALFSQQAALVAVGTSWTRRDVIAHLGVPAEKVQVVALAPINRFHALPEKGDIAATKERYGVPDSFLLYPAQTWPHKNHIRLLEAVAYARDELGIRLDLVMTGTQTEHHRQIVRRQAELGLTDEIHWLGFVEASELLSLYELSTGVVIPTLFESASGPLWEAFAAGRAAACSSVTSLPDQAGGAALLFDPYDTQAMARAMFRLWTEPNLRSLLANRGRARIDGLSWERTARHFRAWYRRILGHTLEPEDRQLLSSPPPL